MEEKSNKVSYNCVLLRRELNSVPRVQAEPQDGPLETQGKCGDPREEGSSCWISLTSQ